MKKSFFVAVCLLLVTGPRAQTVSQKLQKAFQQFQNDAQLKHAISSLYVIDAKTGKVVFDKNSQIGLAPASTQKIVTSVTAFELLGKDYKYKTELRYTGKIVKDTLKGDLFLHCSGDPTLGSGRYKNTTDSILLRRWIDAVKNSGIKSIAGDIIYNHKDFSTNSIPDGWIWQDIGNYYGAGADILNWQENQYEIHLRSGNEVGSKVEILGADPYYINELKAAVKGSGDNAYVYFSKGITPSLISGTIPVGESAFKISASDPDAIQNFLLMFGQFLNLQGVKGKDLGIPTRYYMDGQSKIYSSSTPLSIHYSPTLDSIIYWFNNKSINLYGEALIKTLAYEKNGFGSTEGGIAIVKNFWKLKGIDEDELNISDGSGLSPQNRVTTHAQVEILKYAKSRSWFPYFYQSLPAYNGMAMKSGTIKDVKGFCGYHKAKDGKEYIFSFLVNNYNGPSSGLVNKMYRVLDVLK
jgi:serine-type D-Ala-D-Ala carboxypeptidase/endopeptidase (penicillin-binding protein 4)